MFSQSLSTRDPSRHSRCQPSTNPGIVCRLGWGLMDRSSSSVRESHFQPSIFGDEEETVSVVGSHIEATYR